MSPNDQPHQALTERVDAATPPSLPPYDVVLGRRDRRRTRRRAVVAGSLAAAVAVTGSAAVLSARDGGNPAPLARDRSTGAAPSTLPTEPAASPSRHTPAPAVLESVPTLVVEGDGRSTATFEGSTCWSVPGDDGVSSSLCADKAYPPVDELPDVGSPETVELTSPLAGTTYRAYFTPTVAGCGQAFSIRAYDLGKDRFRFTPTGPAGRYQVSLEGRSPQGTIPGEFVWTVPGTPVSESCS